MAEEKPATLSALDKIAILLACIDEEKAKTLMQHMPEHRAREITKRISNLGHISSDLAERVMSEFAEKFQGVGAQGGKQVAQELLEAAVGEERASELLELSNTPRKEKIASAVDKANPRDLANLLQDEQPALASLILGLMPVNKATEVIQFFDSEFRVQVIKRLSEQREADSATMERIERLFLSKMNEMQGESAGGGEPSIGGPQFVADMLKGGGEATQNEVMERLENDDPDVAENIRELIFTFDDIGNLDDPDVQKVLREVPMDKLVLALRSCSDEVRDKILGNLSKRAQQNLEEEEELLGKVKMKDVKEEQKNVVQIVESLADAGEITMTSGGGEEEEYV